MSKKKLNTEAVLNELQGSVFFPTRIDAESQEESPQEKQQEEDPQTSSQENKETSFQGNKETRNLENKETRKQENVEPRKQVSLETSKRGLFPKVTYQLDPEVISRLEDTKLALKRLYGIKVNLVEIVEEGIKAMCRDVEENKETSFLVNKFSRKQEDQ